MDKNYLFSKVMPSIYQYSYVYELEYSPFDIILIYELEYSFYVMIMSNKTLCLIVHTMFISRIRTKLRSDAKECRLAFLAPLLGIYSISILGSDAKKCQQSWR